MNGSSSLQGLYAITDGSLTPGTGLATAVEAAIRGGARLVQYRDKSTDASRRSREARALADLCRDHGASFIVNDDVELALETGADGVHLGHDDTDITAARVRLGPRALIGVSCYDSLERAVAAAHAGADYVAFGSFYASDSKPGAVRAPLALLTEARRHLSIPLCAIGGITPENGAALVAAGADMLAVIRGVFAAEDVTATAQSYARLFSR
ncbi:MAG TPA: thiamine phosphate synthase [Gammaproteobacteria bacterium]|jgi:thiamine-phosphate pyrophosphorylase|nr:thiamine phosphate synthase [Gammaproteobacteria bacterium]